jgi:endonuclease YncB( thermonuclease family)
MKRPLFRRKPPHKNAKDASSGALRRPALSSRLRFLRNLVIAVAGLSSFQYMNQGEITWPGDLLRNTTDTVSDYAFRPQAGWRKATDALDRAGASKDGVPNSGFSLSGRVVRVADGDTLSVLDATNTQHKIRLYGIDTPERDQPHGRTAWNTLSELVTGKSVGIVEVETDSYGRTVGTVYVGDQNINLYMVERGHAWWYRRHAQHERPLEAAEKQARKQGLGLWADPGAVPPWEWRRRR